MVLNSVRNSHKLEIAHKIERNMIFKTNAMNWQYLIARVEWFGFESTCLQRAGVKQNLWESEVQQGGSSPPVLSANKLQFGQESGFFQWEMHEYLAELS